MAMNPDVTVRFRGVMEKCSYCYQRVSEARIKAENENRDMIDGDVKTACQEACPADAINNAVSTPINILPLLPYLIKLMVMVLFVLFLLWVFYHNLKNKTLFYQLQQQLIELH